MSAKNGVIKVISSDQINKLTVYKSPAPEDGGEATFLFHISAGFGEDSRAITLNSDAVTELICQLTGLVCEGEMSRLQVINDGIEPAPLSPPLQNLLLHIQRAAENRLKDNDNRG